MIKNLIYHIWPVRDRGVWQWNVKQLLQRIDQFNGQRIVSVVTDEQTDTIEAVKAAFKGTVAHFIQTRNDPVLGEVASFPELLKRVENIDPRQLTFYAHAKGVKYPVGAQPMVRRWTRTMYANMLDYPSLVEDALKTQAMVGTFKKSGNSFGGLPPAWHYAGTFFWFRNDRVFDQPLWDRIPRQWWGVEAWPGVVCPTSEAACLLWSDQAPKMPMYQQSMWEQTTGPLWKAWQIKHAGLHRAASLREVVNSVSSKRLVITGPQRSGTTIGAKILASALKLPFISEEEFGTHDYSRFQQLLNSKSEFVVQAPTMSPYVHQLRDCSVVWMRRSLQEVLRSQHRIGWQQHEEIERDRYFDHSHDPIAAVKTRAWELFQRVALEERAVDLDYQSLSSHPLWVAADQRAGFGERQTTYPYS